MPKNRNALRRYQVIDECLRNRFHMPSSSADPVCAGMWSLNEIQEKVFEQLGIEISARQIQQDIQDMRNGELGYLAPIENMRGVGYYYSDPGFRINDNPLVDSDIKLLKEAMSILSQFKGFRNFEEVEGLLARLEEKTARSGLKLIQLDNLNNVEGLNWIAVIKDALYNETVLKMKYKPFNGEVSEKFIHPYVLKEYNNRWFVLCFSEDYGSEGIYGLDRIINLSVCDRKFRKPAPDLAKRYFKDIIGVTNDNEIEAKEIIIKLENRRAAYLVTKPVHESQKLICSDDCYTWFSFYLKQNNELIALLLGFGSDLVIESPPELSDQVIEIYTNALNAYKLPGSKRSR
ncbi:MAG: WYL domain-containing protein [Bacteroidales bacterium]|nr:WYL domain-containing protein [Bacteroidales bacterium]